MLTYDAIFNSLKAENETLRDEVKRLAGLVRLPEPAMKAGRYGYRMAHEDYFTEDQVKAYAVAAVRAQERTLSGKQETASVLLAPLLELLTELHDSEYLSEQQCAKLMGWDLLDWRIATQPAPHPFGQEP